MAIVFRSRVFAVEVGRVRFPNGSEHDIAVVRHPPSVVLLPVDQDGRVILIRQYRPSVDGELWELPEDVRSAIAGDLERTFAFLFEQLNVNGTADHINRFVQAPLQHHAALKPVLVAAADDPDAGE